LVRRRAVTGADLLVDAAERFGTPLYVTDLDRAAARTHAWRDALPGALVAYAVKANPDPALLRRLATEGFGFEVVGPIELALALRAGADPRQIVVNGVGQTDADLAAALASGALVNAESLGALDALLRSTEGRIGIRVNPGIAPNTHPHLATGAADSKFGIALDELATARRALGGSRRSLESVGAHIGSDVDDVDAFARLAELLAGLADELEVERVDIGGGFTGSPAALAAAVRPHLPDPARLIVEPGRSVVAEAGWLLTRIVRLQARGHLVADAGMTELIRPALYGAHHPVSVLRRGGSSADRSWTLSGPICEAGDILGRDLSIGPDVGEGSLLAIGEVGAYGLAMAFGYNGRLLPAQVVIESDQVRLSRRRQTFEDVIARDA
jgi:diaminopimelate decarboxylase